MNPILPNYFRKYQLPFPEESKGGVDPELILECKEKIKAQGVEEISLGQFALLHGDTFLSGSPLEGGEGRETVAYWHALLERWKKNPETNPGLSTEEIEELQGDFNDYIHCRDIECGSDLHALMREGLEQRGRFVLALGTSEHAFAALFEVDKGSTYCHILNKGEGIEYHQTFRSTETKNYVGDHLSLKLSDPSLLEAQNPDALSFFDRILKFRKKSSANETEYNSKEIYDHFLLYFEPIKDLSGKKYASTPQRSGTCSEKIPELLLKHQLKNIHRFKRIKFFVRFQSFLDFLLSYTRNVYSRKDRRVIIKSLQGLSYIAEKYFEEGVLKKEEWLIPLLALEEFVEEKLIKSCRFRTNAEMSFSEESSKIYPYNFIRFFPLVIKKGAVSENKKQRLSYPDLSSINTVEDLITRLKTWITYQQELVDTETTIRFSSAEGTMAHFVYQALSTFPIPSATQRNLWDEIPLDHIDKVIQRLKQFSLKALYGIAEARKKTQEGQEFVYLTYLDRMITFTTFAIVTKLCKRVPEYQLSGWTVPFPLKRDKFKLTSLAPFFSSGFEHDRYLKICAYFSELSWNTQVAFSIHILDSTMNKKFEQGVEYFRIAKGEGREYAKLIHYLKAFSELNKNENKVSEIEYYQKIWVKLNDKYPSIATLQLFSSLSNLPECYLGDYSLSQGMFLKKPWCDLLPELKNGIKSICFDESILSWEKDWIHPETKRKDFVFQYSDEKNYSGEKNTKENLYSIMNCNRELPPESPWHYPPHFQELSKLYLYPELALSTLLDWMRAHRSLLSDPVIQQEIMRHLLNLVHLETQKDLITTMQDFLKEIVTEYRFFPPQWKEGLFWMRVAYRFASFKAKKLYLKDSAFKHDHDVEYIPPLLDQFLEKKELAVELRYEISLLKLYHYVQLNEVPRDDAASFLLLWIGLPILRQTLPKETLERTFTLEVEVSAFVMRTMHQIGKDIERDARLWDGVFAHLERDLKIESQTWTLEWPVCRCGDWQVNFLTGRVVYRGAALGESWEQVFNGKALRALVPLEEPICFNAQAQELIASQQRIRCWKDGRKEVVEREFTFPHLKGWYQYAEMSESEGIPKYYIDNAWSWMSMDESNPHLLFVDAETDVPLALKKASSFYQLNRWGKETGRILLNLEKIDGSSTLAQLLRPFSVSWEEEFLVWKEKQNETVTEIHWHPLGLTFEASVEDPSHFYCAAFPGYFLDPLQGIDVLDFMPGTVTLSNSEGKQLLVIPCRRLEFLQYYHPNISTDYFFSRSLLSTEKKKTRYFTYTYDEKRAMYVSQERTAMLYLMGLYVFKEQYEEALEILNSLNPLTYYTQDDWTLLFHFLRVGKDPELCRSAFFLKLGLHLSDTLKLQLKEEQRKQEPFSSMSDEQKARYRDYMQEHSDFYLSTSHTHDFSRIPEALKLTERERIQVQKEMGFFQKNPIPSHSWSFSVPREFPTKIKLNTYTYLYNLEIGTRIEVLLNSLRMTQETIEKNFFTLYDYYRTLKPGSKRARFDYFAFTHTENTEQRLYANLLFFVAETDPEAFPPLPDDLRGSKDRRLEFFNEIVETARRLATKTPTQEERKFLLTEAVAVENSVPLKEKKIASLPIVLPLPSDCGDVYFPLQHIHSRFLDEKTMDTLQRSSFALNQQNLTTSSELGKKLYQTFEEAYQKNQTKRVTRSLPRKEELTTLENALKAERETQRKAAQKMQEEFEKKANHTPFDQEESLSTHDFMEGGSHKLRLRWKQRSRLTLKNGLYEGVLTRSPDYLKEQNPFLTDEMIQEIYADVMAYMIIQNRLDQLEEALEKITDYKEAARPAEQESILREIGEIISKKRGYKPQEYPSFLIYEYATGNLLRPNQVKLLKWIFTEKDEKKKRELFIEFPAGEGKTKVIAAILACREIAKGQLPVFFSLPALHEITKEDLSSVLGSVFGKKLRLLEMGLDTALSDQELKKLEKELHIWLEEGCCLQICPETFHALKLQYWFALKGGDLARSKILFRMLNFFKEKGVFIIDEAHRNAESLFEANFAIGQPHSIQEDEIEIFILCYRALTGAIEGESLKLKDGREVAELLALEKNEQALVSEQDISLILEALAEYLTLHPRFKIPESEQKELAVYLVDKNRPIPQYVKKLYHSEKGKRRAEHLFLVRGLLTEHLRTVLGLVHGFNYGESVRKETEVEAPRLRKSPTKFQFECTDIAVLLSIQGLLQRGLNREQMRKLVEALLKAHYTSVEAKGKYPESSAAAQEFKRWQETTKSPLRLSDLEATSYYKLVDENLLPALVKTCGKHPAAQDKYLRDYLLPQNRIYPQKLSTSAYHLIGGAKKSLLFSATLGLDKEYPQLGEEAIHPDYAFQAAVIQRACEGQNSECFWLKQSSPKAFFEEVYRKNSHTCSTANGIIDVGGRLKDYTTREVGEAWLDFAKEKKIPCDGVLYISETGDSEEGAQQLHLLLDKKGERQTIPLKGSHLKKALREANIEAPHKLRLFKIYAADQCTGTDLALERDAKMLLLISETTTLWHLIQAIMRMRDFLRPVVSRSDRGQTQRIVWIGSDKLKKKIPQLDLGPQAIFMWALNQEAEQMERRILVRAMQEITGVIQSYIERDLSSLYLTEIFKNHPGAFIEKLGRDLRALYAEPSRSQETAVVLKSFYTRLIQAADLNVKEWKRSDEAKNIKRIIDETATLIPTLSNKEASPSLGIGVQENQALGESKQENQGQQQQLTSNFSRDFCKVSNPYARYTLKLDYPQLIDIESHGIYIRPAHSLLPQKIPPFFSKHLYLLKNARDTLKGKEVLKPINHLLIIREEEKVYVYALSKEDAIEYQHQFSHCPEFQNRKMLLTTTYGDRICHSSNCAYTTFQELLGEELAEKILSDVHLLKGKVYNPKFFGKDAKKWCEEHGEEKFDEFLSYISALQICHAEMDLASMKEALHKAKEAELLVEESEEEFTTSYVSEEEEVDSASVSFVEDEIEEELEEEEVDSASVSAVSEVEENPQVFPASSVSQTPPPVHTSAKITAYVGVFFLTLGLIATGILVFQPLGNTVFLIAGHSITTAPLISLEIGLTGSFMLFIIAAVLKAARTQPLNP